MDLQDTQPEDLHLTYEFLCTRLPFERAHERWLEYLQRPRPLVRRLAWLVPHLYFWLSISVIIALAFASESSAVLPYIFVGADMAATGYFIVDGFLERWRKFRFLERISSFMPKEGIPCRIHIDDEGISRQMPGHALFLD